MSRPDDDFLGRWSARKLQARAEPASEPEGEIPPQSPAAVPDRERPDETLPEKTDAEVLEELGLPDPDSLVKGDDFKAFLGAAIPARLRARALRRLWVSDPVLANLDGLNDYDQDFTDAATVRPDLKTAYRVGKGLLREVPQAGTGAAEAPSPPSDDPAAESGPEPAADPASAEHDGGAPAEPAVVASAPAEPGVAAETAAEAAPQVGRPRRMSFRFETG